MQRCLLMSLLFISQWSAGQAMSARVERPDDTATYEEVVIDMEIQTLGGVLKLERKYANRRWTFNPDWADLQFFSDKKDVSISRFLSDADRPPSAGLGFSRGAGSATIGNLNTVPDKQTAQTIRRNEYSYKAVDSSLTLYRNLERKTIRRLENGSYRWEDRRGNWIEYNEHGKATRFGDRNNITLTLVRNAEGDITSIEDHFGATLATWTLDPNGRPLTLTDYTEREVSYTWQSNQLRVVNDVLGNNWFYNYSDDTPVAVMSNKIDPENREIQINHRLSYGVETTGTTFEGLSENGGGSGAFINPRQWILESISDVIGTQVKYEFFYDAPTKTYRTTTTEAGRGRVSQTVNLDGEITATYVNDDLLFESDIANDRRRMVQTDKNDNRTVWEFDEYHNPVKVSWADGSTESWSYNSFSQVTQYKNANGVITKNEYDANGNLTRTTEAVGTAAERITEFEYDEHGRLTLLRQVGDARTPEAITRWTSYDNYGNPLIQIDPEGVETRFTWDVMGNLLTYRDGRQNTWSWTYDAAGNLLTETDPLNHSTIYNYDKVGNLLTITDALGIVQMSFSYNARDSITSITNAYSQTQTYVYNDQNQLIEAKDENNKISRIAYDASGRPTTVTDAVGNVISFDWGKNNSHLFGLSEIHYPTFSERYSYDKRYRITGIERYAGESVLQTVGYRYDDEGNLTEIIDPANRSSKKFYDELNRLVSMQDPANNFVSLVYDDRDNIRSVTNELNTLIREFTYSLRNEQEQVTWPNGSTFTSQWDANGNLETYTDAKGQIHRHTWDAANRLSETRYFENIGALNAEPPNPLKTVTYAYNNADSLTGYNDGVTSATYSYDNMQRNTGATVNYGPFTRSHSYSFNTVGKKASLTNPDGSVNQFFYDNAQRLNRINLVGEGNITVNSYNWLAPEKVTLPGGSVQETTYDPLMRVKSIKVSDPAANSVLNYSYEYDAVGNITSKNTEHGNYSYTYDELDRLLSANNPDFGAHFGGGDGAFTETFTYDATGNRKTSAETEGEWLYNTTNQLLQIGTEGPVYTYDANGNVETKTELGLTETYIYNVENRLSEVRDNDNSVIATYTYDPFGRRLSKTTNEGTRYFYYADEGLIAEFDAAGQAIQSYGYAPDSLWGTDPVFTKNSSNSYAYYLNDHLGTPQQLIQGNGAVVWSAKYRAFGLASLGQGNSWDSHLRFAGQYGDTETVTHYNYFRNYDSKLGRYIQSDPIGLDDGPNTYFYTGNNPLVFIDEDGRSRRRVAPQPSPSQVLINAQVNSLIHQVRRYEPGFVYHTVRPIGPQGRYNTNDIQALQQALRNAQTAGYCGPGASTGRYGSHSPNFVVDSSGQTFPVPPGAVGPRPVTNNNGNVTGSAFVNGSGGTNGQVSNVRIMNRTKPKGKNPGYPNGYVKYGNSNGQGVDPYTGQTIPNSQNHFPINSNSQTCGCQGN